MAEKFEIREVQLSYIPKKSLSDAKSFRSSKDLHDFLVEHIYEENTIYHREFFNVLLFDNRLRLLGYRTIAEGGVGSCLVDLKILMQIAILSNATSIAIAHNHPSGHVQPSKADDMLSKSVAEACNLFKIRLIDHIVVAPEQYYSYADEDKINH